RMLNITIPALFRRPNSGLNSLRGMIANKPSGRRMCAISAKRTMAVLIRLSIVSEESWPRKFEQADKWSFCLKAAMIAANRRDHEQTTAPEPQRCFQGEGGACRRQGRSDAGPIGRAFR